MAKLTTEVESMETEAIHSRNITRGLVLSALLVMCTLTLLTCDGPSAPQLDEFSNIYDPESDNYIPTADLNTAPVTGIRALQAESGGQFETDYGKPVTARGVCWSTEEEPTVVDDCTNDGQGHGAFTSVMRGLEPDQTYYVRAYATNEAGTIYGGQREFRTMDGKPELITNPVQEVRAYSAQVSGEVHGDGGAALLRWGVCYAENPEPTTSDDCLDAEGSASQKMSGDEGELLSGYGTSKDGRDSDRQSPGGFSGIGTIQDSDWSAGMPDGPGTAPGSAHQSVLESGSQGSPGRQNMKDSPQDTRRMHTGSDELTFNLHLEGLTPGQRYYIRTFAVNEAGASYGPEVSFTTRDGIAILTTKEPFDVTAFSAKTGGEITDDGGADITARGVCYVEGNGEPGLSDTCVEAGSGTGSFEVLLEDLLLDQQYSVRAYATTGAGTGYGGQRNFTTRDGRAVVTIELESKSALSIRLKGDIVSEFPITSYGVCYDETPNPDMSSECVGHDGDSESYSIELDGLTAGTSYHIFAYAINKMGTGSSDILEVTTRDGIPVLTTIEPFEIKSRSARTGGTITDDGGAHITARGVCYVEGSGEPGVSDTCVESGNGTGSFEVMLEDLSPVQQYSVQAYAMTEFGTNWGQVWEFTTALRDWPIDTDTEVVEVTSPTGRVWMDRNLGASRAATSSHDFQAFGDLYQWGRAADGHQRRNSSTTTTLNNTDQPGHGSFILAPNSPYDWRSPQNNNLWQGENGVNNPCPAGYRLPTEAEWNAERNSWSSNNASGALNSPLKLPVAGGRSYSSGSLFVVGSDGYYWSSTVFFSGARYLLFGSSPDSWTVGRAGGMSVRCIKDE